MLITTGHRKGCVDAAWPGWLCPTPVKHIVPNFAVRRNTLADDEDDEIREARRKEAERREQLSIKARAAYWARQGKPVPPHRWKKKREAI